MANKRAIRGSIITFVANPFVVEASKSYRYYQDGLIILDNGIIEKVGSFDDLSKLINNDFEVLDYSGSLLTAGCIDTHVHYPQTPMIAAYGEHLLEWLNQYTFPTELKLKDKAFASSVAKMFLKTTLKAGTTTSVVYGTVFKDSVDAFFEESERLGTRMLCGKVMMDRNAPDGLLDTPQSGYDDSKELIERWHNNGRQKYVITPRFAPSCSGEQLQKAGQLYKEYPDVYIQTHLCENTGEIAWVKELFPERKSYTDVYDHYGLVGERAVFGHCVHFNEEDFKTLSEKKAAIAHCPTSNLFLGSGLFDLEQAVRGKYPCRVGLGTDIGAGTSFCHMQTLNEAYKISELLNHKLTAVQGYYLATLGGAESIYLDDKIGSIAEGKEADIVVWDLHSTELIRYRMSFSKSLEEDLFTQLVMADDRSVRATIVNGNVVYDRDRGFYSE